MTDTSWEAIAVRNLKAAKYYREGLERIMNYKPYPRSHPLKCLAATALANGDAVDNAD